MTRNLKICLALVGVFVVGVAAMLLIDRSGPGGDTPVAGSGSSVHVRPDSHRLNTAPDGEVTFVEFLDFECEACAAFYPLIEKLRGDYGDRVTFVARYFPLPSHYNAERAARAVEAAARQGRFEQMYQKMYETQRVWGEQRTPKDAVFRGFAADLGLDLAKFDTDYDSPAVSDRVRADFADGTALGVQGTPTFFLNGEKLSPRSYEDFTRALDAALA